MQHGEEEAMSSRECIFDGDHEKELFGRMNSIWENSFNVYPQLPFTKIFDIETLNVSSNEKDFLLKTNIDYTVCDKRDKPLMCIEFDGWGHGYNRGGEYVQILEDPRRKWKLELKLKIAMEHDFPFYITSYDEMEYLSPKIHLTVIDGIIGQTIAKLNLQDKINEYLENSKDIVSSMSEYEAHEYIQELVWSAEAVLELAWDLIAKKEAEIESMLSAKGVVSGYTLKFLSKPELPKMKDMYDIEGLQNRLRAWKDIKWHGCEVSCKTPRGEVTQRALVRNFEGMLASPITIANNIAKLLAFSKAATLNGIEI
jgi:hypothetical protein